jgi:hypothetical protein
VRSKKLPRSVKFYMSLMPGSPLLDAPPERLSCTRIPRMHLSNHAAASSDDQLSGNVLSTTSSGMADFRPFVSSVTLDESPSSEISLSNTLDAVTDNAPDLSSGFGSEALGLDDGCDGEALGLGDGSDDEMPGLCDVWDDDEGTGFWERESFTQESPASPQFLSLPHSSSMSPLLPVVVPEQVLPIIGLGSFGAPVPSAFPTWLPKHAGARYTFRYLLLLC